MIPKGQIADRLNFSNWPLTSTTPAALKDFQRKYGTKVKYTEEINDNDEFFGKVRPQLERGSSGGRDLFAVTDWMAGRMIRLGYVQKLDKSALPNVQKNLRAERSSTRATTRTVTTRRPGSRASSRASSTARTRSASRRASTTSSTRS